MTFGFLVAFSLFLFGAFFVGALAGYGGGLLSLPLLAWLLADVRGAVFICLIFGGLQAYHVLATNRKDIVWPAFWKMTLWCGLGIPVGFLTGRYLPERPLLLTLGLVIAVSGVIRLLPALAAWSMRTPRVVRRGLLFTGGTLQGAFAAGGAPIVLVAQQMLPIKQDFRATLFMLWATLNTFLIGAFLVTQTFEAADGYLLLLGLPAVLLANHLGDRAGKWIPQREFGVVVSGLLVAAGLITIARATGVI